MGISDLIVQTGSPFLHESVFAAFVPGIEYPGVVIPVCFSVDYAENTVLRVILQLLKDPVPEGFSINVKVHAFIIKSVRFRDDPNDLFGILPPVGIYQAEDEFHVVAPSVNRTPVTVLPVLSHHLRNGFLQQVKFIPFHQRVMHPRPPVSAESVSDSALRVCRTTQYPSGMLLRCP